MDPQQQQQQQYSIPMDHLFHASSMSPIFSTTQPYPPQPTTPIHTAPPTIPQHPPYEEMITMAIVALNESEGSSKQAISKYLDRVFKNLPSNHSELLAYHMKRLKNSGQIVLYKRSYLLPSRSAPPPPPPCNVAATSNGGAAAGSTLTSLSPSGISAAQNIGNSHYNYQSYYDVPVGSNQNEEQASVAARRVDHPLPVVSKNVAPPAEGNGGISGSEAMFVSLGLSDGPSVEVTPQTKKRRGRPPKSASSGAGLGQGTLDSGVGKDDMVQSSAVGQETVQSSSVGQEILGSSSVGQGIQGLVEESGSKRKRGRPRKSESSGGPPAPGVFPVQVPVGDPTPTPAPVSASVPAASGTGRARGKPKRYADEAVIPNRKLGGKQPKKRGRKPKNLGLMAIYSADPVTMVIPNPGNNAGDVVNQQQYTVVSSNGVTQVPSGKRRGRPPGVGRLNKHMKFTGKPMGRPRKNPSAQIGTPNVDNSQSLTVQNLKSNLVYLQSKIRENVSIIKHFVNMETSVDAMGALEHLEELATAEF